MMSHLASGASGIWGNMGQSIMNVMLDNDNAMLQIVSGNSRLSLTSLPVNEVLQWNHLLEVI